MVVMAPLALTEVTMAGVTGVLQVHGPQDHGRLGGVETDAPPPHGVVGLADLGAPMHPGLLGVDAPILLLPRAQSQLPSAVLLPPVFPTPSRSPRQLVVHLLPLQVSLWLLHLVLVVPETRLLPELVLELVHAWLLCC